MSQERDRVPRRLVWPTAIVSAVIFFAALGVVTAFHPRAKPAPPPPSSPVDQGPILRATTPPVALDRWAWVDRERGIVRVPIETAMKLVEDGR